MKKEKIKADSEKCEDCSCFCDDCECTSNNGCPKCNCYEMDDKKIEFKADFSLTVH